jgi:ParB family chromosome partitioning protein
MTTSVEKGPVIDSGQAMDKLDKSGAKINEKVAEKRKALGRGLESLLPSGPRPVPSLPQRPDPSGSSGAAVVVPESSGQVASQLRADIARAEGDSVQPIPLDLIDDNPYQTRNHFETEALSELADSIRSSGLLQPIVVRPGKPGRYVLVLGERRCRASRLAGSTSIPAIVRKISDQQAAEMTVVENLQRQDLTCLEQATAFAKLSRDFGLTQEQIGQRVGVSRESVSNYMRLLKLPEAVLHHLRQGDLGFSEARVLLQLFDHDTMVKLADEAVRKHLSVLQLQALVERTKAAPTESEKLSGDARSIDPNVRAAQGELEKMLGVRVRIRDRKGKGRIVIEYTSIDDFDRVVEMLKGPNPPGSAVR